MRSVTVTYLDASLRWQRGRLSAGQQGDGLRLEPTPESRDVECSDGVITGGFTDWHVHLHLIEVEKLANGPLARVHDLGGVPSHLQATQVKLPLQVLHAGAFLTPPGGYPSGRAWAPAASVREVTDVSDASEAVREMVAAGANAIKVASNSEAGPVFSDDTFRAIVGAAHHAGLRVTAHAEGPGEALRAARLGATRLAHAPFTELLYDTHLAELAARTSWISTLDIHGWGDYRREHEVASANVAGFVRHGGHLHYGTDMGNGPTVTGLNVRELDSLAAAGLTPAQQLAALSPLDPLKPNTPLVWVPRGVDGSVRLAHAARISAEFLATVFGNE
jgi:imidazolonepropionase-like amidohydrolase